MTGRSRPVRIPRITDPRVIRRFTSKLRCYKTEHDIWWWTGARAANGYGRFNLNGRSVPAHRIAWAIYRGPIEDGMVIHHKSPAEGVDPVILDCNPDHLEAVTHAYNVTESNGRRWNSNLISDPTTWPCSRCGSGVMIRIMGRFECLHCGHKQTTEPTPI